VVELLVVIGVIGVLMAMLLPAVQAVRESARRTACCSNLSQIGVGLQSYHQMYERFPVGCLECRVTFPHGRQLAWSAFLLPQTEQQPLYDRIDFSKAFDSAENAEAAATVVDTYICPSVSRSSYLIDGRAVSDYGGINGERIQFPGLPPRHNDPPKGVMLYERPITISEIRDGTSQTLIIAESAGWKDGQWINGLNIFDQAYAINFPPDLAHGIYPENEIRSDHPGGANGLFCDGSARFLSETMELRTLAAICTRAGGEIVDEF
jgi:prepilin-type processing-associated H-X9-DG protein